MIKHANRIQNKMLMSPTSIFVYQFIYNFAICQRSNGTSNEKIENRNVFSFVFVFVFGACFCACKIMLFYFIRIRNRIRIRFACFGGYIRFPFVGTFFRTKRKGLTYVTFYKTERDRIRKNVLGTKFCTMFEGESSFGTIKIP